MTKGFKLVPRGLCLFTALLFLLAPVASSAEEQPFRVATSKFFINNSLKPLGIMRTGEPRFVQVADCPKLTEPFLKDNLRIVMEFMFLCHALRQGDVADVIEIVETPNQFRALTLLSQRDVDAYYVSQPIEALTGDFANILSSDPVIDTDQFSKALFTTANRTDILSVSTREEILQLRGITVESWITDVAALESIQMAQVIAVPTSPNVSPMIEKGRADVFPADLSREVLTRWEPNLHRVDGFRVRIPVTRSMLFAPHQSEALAAMQTYIRTHRAMDPDPLLEAYYHVGFLTRDYDHWEVLNPAEGTQTTN